MTLTRLRSLLLQGLLILGRVWRLIQGWRGILCILLVVLPTITLRFTFLENWTVSYGNVLVTIEADSDIGFLSLEMHGSLTNSYRDLTIPTSSYDDFPADNRMINIYSLNITRGSLHRISVIGISLSASDLTPSYPMGGEGWHNVSLRVPRTVNCSAWIATDLVAWTPLGDIVVYRATYAARFTNGGAEHLGKVGLLHPAFHIPEFLLLGFCSVLSIVTGLLFYSKSRRFPFGLCLVLALSSFLFVLVGTGFDLLFRDPLNLHLKRVMFALSSLFHFDYDHFTSNLTALIPLSLVVECGLKWRSAARKMLLYFICVFPGSWITGVLQALFNFGTTGFGMSVALMWLASLYFLIVIRSSSESFSKERLLLLGTMIAGYVIIGSTYGYLAEAIIRLGSEGLELARTHIEGVMTAVPTLWVVLSRLGRVTED